MPSAGGEIPHRRFLFARLFLCAFMVKEKAAICLHKCALLICNLKTSLAAAGDFLFIGKILIIQTPAERSVNRGDGTHGEDGAADQVVQRPSQHLCAPPNHLAGASGGKIPHHALHGQRVLLMERLLVVAAQQFPRFFPVIRFSPVVLSLLSLLSVPSVLLSPLLPSVRFPFPRNRQGSCAAPRRLCRRSRCPD